MRRALPTPGKTFIVATLLTILVTTLLVMTSPPQAEAVSVTVSPSSSSVTQGDSITFTATVQIQSSESIPIQNAYLRLFSDASASYQLTTSPYSSPRTMSLSNSSPSGGNYGYRQGYGYDNGTLHNFGYGYGYGGYSSTVTLEYQCTIATTTQWSNSTYYARADIDCGSHTFSSSLTNFTVSSQSTPSGGGGGGGGGGAVPPPATTMPPTTVIPPATATPPTPPATPPVTTEAPADIATEKLTGKITPDGVVTEAVTLVSVDNSATTTIPAGTIALGPGGKPLTEITVQPPDATAPPPPDANMIVVADFGPDGATFDPPITITMEFDPSTLAEGVTPDDLVLAYYNTQTGEWETLDNVRVNPGNATVSGDTDHFTQFAILAKQQDTTVIPPTTTKPAPTIQPVDDDDGINIWIIIGPVVAIVVIAMLGFLEYQRRKSEMV